MRASFEVALGVLFTLVVGALGITVATAFDRQPPVLASSVEGRTPVSVYHPGDTFAGMWSMKAVRVCTGAAQRWVDVVLPNMKHWIYRLPPVPVMLSDHEDVIPGRIEYPITAFQLPPDAPTGPATYNHVDYFACSPPGNWLFPTQVIYTPIKFSIEPR